MKKNIILCCVTCCLLLAFPENKGSRLKDSLSCVLQYSKVILTCSWSESKNAVQFVNMTLKEKNGTPVCDEMEPVKITPTHLNWTCHKNVSFSEFSLHYQFHFIFAPDRSLESRLNVSNKGDEAKPKKLRCQVSGQMIICFWEVRQEVADSVDFTLYYQNVTGKEEACQPRCRQEIPMYLSCTCNFTASHDTAIQLYNISVKPTDPNKSFVHIEVCENIKLEPRILTVKEYSKGETFEISWKNQSELTHFNYKYELCYWSESDLKPNGQAGAIDVASDCPGVTKEESTSETHLRLRTQLQPTRNYSVKVRVRVSENHSEQCYKGPWSEWSNVQTFHTKSVVSTVLLSILVLAAVVILVICSVCGCRALVRRKKQWDNSIPNPSKSSIVKGLRKAKDRLVIRYLTLQNGPSLPHEEHHYVEPYNKVLVWTPSKKETDLLKQDKEQIPRPDSEFLQDDDTQCLALFKMTKEEEYPAASVTEGYTPFSELIDEKENQDMEGSQFAVCAFDGPYLFS